MNDKKVRMVAGLKKKGNSNTSQEGKGRGLSPKEKEDSLYCTACLFI